jgi:hypothetical protein
MAIAEIREVRKIVSDVDFVRQLAEQLNSMEASAREYDAGNPDEAIRIARGLAAIFHLTPESQSLLASLQARLTRVLTSVEKPPYPHDWYSPLAEAQGQFQFPEIHAGASRTSQAITVVGSQRFQPLLDRKKLSRQVQAPEWWGNEPVIILRGKKTTRKDIVLRASGRDGGRLSDKDPGTAETEVGAGGAAALRQMAYEVLRSPELLKLAGIAG